jgi:glycosyltransferase involved in cell wall biosynthesis/SAM-dependent methyltransferase
LKTRTEAAAGSDARGESVIEVSVVVIFLDADRFLQEAIDSVFAQTDDNWELLLVDDGSTDRSGDIARRAEERRPGRVRYLEHPGHRNLGRSASRNLGIEHARGRFVAFLDADDVFLPRKLERQLALLRSRPDAGMVYGATILWYSWTGDPLDADRDFAPDLGVATGVPLNGPAYLSRMLRREIPSPCTCSMLLRRDVVREVGGFEPAFRGMYDDQAFVAKVCLATSLVASGESWDRYRRRPDSCYSVAKVTGEDQAARRFFLEWLDTYLNVQGIGDEGVRSSLDRERNAARQTAAPRPPDRLRRIARRLVSGGLRRLRLLRRRGSAPDPGRVDFGSLRRLAPISRRWGKDRGLPIDRYYIEEFLAANATDIRGRVLEVGDASYTRRFGGDRVTHVDVLHAASGNRNATIVADMARGDALPSAAFDCVILTQVLHVIADPAAAVRTVRRILRPGGVVLATFAGISQISRWDMERWGDSWRFTTKAARSLFTSEFPPELVSVESHGNVLAAIAFLHGLATRDLRREELDHNDPDYQLLITVRAEKPGPPAGGEDGSRPG